jgi:hypothetical protein
MKLRLIILLTLSFTLGTLITISTINFKNHNEPEAWLLLLSYLTFGLVWAILFKRFLGDIQRIEN